MRFSTICEIFERVAGTSGTNQKVAIVTDFLRHTPGEEVPLVVQTLTGTILSRGAPLNVGYNILWKIAQQVVGATDTQLEKARQAHGDLAGAMESLFSQRKSHQATLFAKTPPTLKDLVELYQRLEVTGSGSITRKKQWIASFLDRLSAVETKYFVRLLLGWLNIGFQTTLVLRAIAEAANVPEEALRKTILKYPEAGEVARVAFTEGAEGLAKIQIRPLIPVLPMLAMVAASLEGALQDFGGTVAAEYKYDGIRLQVHQDGDRVEIFSRRLNRLTDQFPDVVAGWRECTQGNRCLVEGEIVGMVDGKITPFQVFMRRIRTHKIEATVQQVPVVLFLFDVLFAGDQDITHLPYLERYTMLENLFVPSERIRLATRIVSSDAKELQEFFEQAVAAQCEGIMLKDLRADYMPGTRGTRILKYKKTLETLDLVLVGAEYGEGRKSAIFSRFFFAAWDDARTKLTTLGKVSTGLTDEDTQILNDRLASLIVEENGRQVTINPQLVCEILADEILESPRFVSGYALRFARIVRIREDLGIEDVDDIKRVKDLFLAQRSRKNYSQ